MTTSSIWNKKGRRSSSTAARSAPAARSRSAFRRQGSPRFHFAPSGEASAVDLIEVEPISGNAQASRIILDGSSVDE
jgi:hypothetical protein